MGNTHPYSMVRLNFLGPRWSYPRGNASDINDYSLGYNGISRYHGIYQCLSNVLFLGVSRTLAIASAAPGDHDEHVAPPPTHLRSCGRKAKSGHVFGYSLVI